MGGNLDTLTENMDLPTNTTIENISKIFIDYVKGAYGVTSSVLGE